MQLAGGIIPTSRQNISYLYKPGTVALLTTFLVLKNSAASSQVMVGAAGQTFYLAVEEILQPAALEVSLNLSESDSVSDDSHDSWDMVR